VVATGMRNRRIVALSLSVGTATTGTGLMRLLPISMGDFSARAIVRKEDICGSQDLLRRRQPALVQRLGADFGTMLHIRGRERDDTDPGRHDQQASTGIRVLCAHLWGQVDGQIDRTIKSGLKRLRPQVIDAERGYRSSN